MSFDDKILLAVMSLLFCFMVWLLYHAVVGWKQYKILIAKEKEEEERNKKTVDKS